jgi:hypothetical protein
MDYPVSVQAEVPWVICELAGPTEPFVPPAAVMAPGSRPAARRQRSASC